MPATHTPRDARNGTPWFEDVVILLTLVAFAVAQTVYDVVASNPELLAARRVTNAQLLAVVGCYGLVPAIVLGALWSLCRRFSALLHRAVFSGLILVFSLAVFWQARNTYLGEGEGLLHAAWLWVIPGAALAFLGWRKERGFRSFLLALSPAILIFPALFLYRTWRTPIAPPPLAVSVEASSELTPPLTPNGAPVFVLVFDELALHVLLDADGKIDGRSYPNFAKLSGESHWFRNATSNSSKTITAIAAIVAGKLPGPGDSNHAHYPNTMFSLLAPAYEVFIEEVGYTNFCDSEAYYCLNDATGDGTAGLLRDLGYLLAARVLPAKLDFGLPDTSHTWGPFQTVEDWMGAALARGQRVLHAVDALPMDHLLFFAHVILPHSPYALTPEGEIYSVGPYALDQGQDTATLAWMLERYRMQVRYVDRWLGEFLTRLQQRKLYDPALLIVTADHGVSWKPEAPGRTLYEENAEMMLPVPLFVKLPFQNEPGYSERDVQHIDVVPTIAGVLETALPFAVEGRSVFAPQGEPRKKVAYGDGMVRFEFDGGLGLRPLEGHDRDSRFVGESIDRFRVIEDAAVRGKLEAMQFIPPGAPEFAAALPVQVSGWALRVDAEAALLEAEPGTSHSGELSLAFQGASGGARQPLQGLTAGSRYRARAWVRSAAPGSGRASLTISRPGVEVLESAGILPAGEFRPIELAFSAPQDGKALLTLQYSGRPARVYWDDVSVTEIATGTASAAGTETQPREWIANGGFEEPLEQPWSAFGPALPALGGQGLEVVVTLNGVVVGSTRPGAERWDVAKRLLSPGHRYLRCGWSIAIPAERLQEGENPLQAYAVIDAAKRTAVRLDSGWPRILVKKGESLDRKMPQQQR
jgi:hypothetical protein